MRSHAITVRVSRLSDSTDSSNTLFFWDFVSLQEATRQQGKGHNSDRTRLVISSARPTLQVIRFVSRFTPAEPGPSLSVVPVLVACLIFGVPVVPPTSLSFFGLSVPSALLLVAISSLHLRRCLRFSSSTVWRTLLCSNRDRYHGVSGSRQWSCLSFSSSTVWKTFLFGNRDRYRGLSRQWSCLSFSSSTVWKTFLFGNRDRYHGLSRQWRCLRFSSSTVWRTLLLYVSTPEFFLG